MPINVDKVRPFRLLKTHFFTPFVKQNKRFGSAIFLLTPTIESSLRVMNSSMMENLNMFNSYYMEWKVFYSLKNGIIKNESMDIEEPFSSSVVSGHPMITESYYQDSDNLFFFNEATPESMINSRLKQILFKERIKTASELKKIRDFVKSNNPNIKFFYPKIEKYNNRNLFIDNSYYHNLFLNNNKFTQDRCIDLMYALFSRFINNPEYKSYKRKTVIVPVNDWCQDIPSTMLFNHQKFVNPITMIHRLFKKPKESLSNLFGIDFIFMNNFGWFKLRLEDLDNKNLNLFKANIIKMHRNEPVEDNVPEDKDDIKTVVIDKIERDTNIEVNNLDVKGAQDAQNTTLIKSLSGKQAEPTEDEIKKVKAEDKKSTADKISSEVDKVVSWNISKEDAEKEIDQSTRIKELILQAVDDEDDTFKISATRKARLDSLNDKFLRERLNNTPISELVKTEDTPLESTDLTKHVESIDDEWKDLKKPNFEKDYNIDADIMQCIYSFSKNKDVPMSVIDVTQEDRSTSEDAIITYTVHLEDSLGKRHTIKFDMPKIINNRFLRLRGNDKVVPGQLVNLPIIKTDEDTVQVVSNYNKIFITRYGQAGKLNSNIDNLIKALNYFIENGEPKELYNDYEKENIYDKIVKIQTGNNAKICSKYELPMEYVELAKFFNKITFKSGGVIYFNQDELRDKLIEKKIKVDETKLTIGITGNNEPIMVENNNVAKSIAFMCTQLAPLIRKYDKPGKRLTYSQASILNGKIPLIVVMAYTAGLTKALEVAGIRYEFSEKRPTDTKTYVKFNDGFMKFFDHDNNYDESSLLFNGLMILPTEDYSVTDIDRKAMWLDMLEEFGSRNRADGLDSFANLMMDPITVEVCKTYKLPTTYLEALAYASSLLTTNKYNRHVDITGNRFRTNERLVHFLYKSLATSYGEYLREIKNNRKDAKMTMKQSAVIDMALADVTTSDLSKLSPLLELESANTVTFKGLSGMNSDRSYSLDKRTYDKSMLNKLSMSTGFSSTVGINRQATINMGITSTKGYIKSGNELDKMSDASTLSITEALTPFGTTHDDPFRTAMTFIQTSKHGMRTTKQDPLLVTNGADQALPYLTSDTFAHKAKSNSIVEEVTDDYIILKNIDNTREFVDLREKVEKNSDGGFFITIKLDPSKNYKVGDKVKAGDIVAYDKSSYSDTVGEGNLAYNIGTLTKIAIMHTEKGFEDSAIISHDLSEKMASEIVLQVDTLLDAKDIDIECLEVGSQLQEGQTIMSYRSSFEDQDATDIIAKMVEKNSDSKDLVNDLGKILIKSKVTGVLQDIKVYSTVDKSEMSKSLAKFVSKFDTPVEKMKAKLSKIGIDGSQYGTSGVLPAIGKLKHAEGKVLVEFYIKYKDSMSVGDKLVYFSALKGVVKEIFPKGEEPTSEYRPEEKIHSFLPVGSVNARMVSSVLIVGGINKVLIELDRHVKDIMGVKWDPNI